MPMKHNREDTAGGGAKSLSAGLKQGALKGGSEKKSLFAALKGGGKAKKGGIKAEGTNDVKTDITFGGAKAMMKKTSKKK